MMAWMDLAYCYYYAKNQETTGPKPQTALSGPRESALCHSETGVAKRQASAELNLNPW